MEGSQTGLSHDETQTAGAANPCTGNGPSLAGLEEILPCLQAPLHLFPFLQSPLTQSALNFEHEHHCAENRPLDSFSHTIILVSALAGSILDNMGPCSFSDQRMNCGNDGRASCGINEWLCEWMNKWTVCLISDVRTSPRSTRAAGCLPMIILLFLWNKTQFSNWGCYHLFLRLPYGQAWYRAPLQGQRVSSISSCSM